MKTMEQKKLVPVAILLALALLAGIPQVSEKACAMTGITVGEWPVSGAPYGIAAGPDGALWFTERDGNRIGRITTGGEVTEWSLPNAYSSPVHITDGPDGALWFTEYSGNRIGRISTAGTINEWELPNAGSHAWDITAGPDGALWFTEESGNRIGRITTAGDIKEYDTGMTPGSYPHGIAAGPDGALWFTESMGNRIGRITTAGDITEYPLPSAGSYPHGIAAGPDGALWFTEYKGDRIGRITTGGAISEWGLPSQNCDCEDILLGPDGALWFTEYSGNRIGRITAAGSIKDWSLPTAGSGPWGIAAGPDGALWFTEAGGYQVGRASIGSSWYLAEGCTDGGFETWVLVQNPGVEDAVVDVTLMTGEGPLNLPELQDVRVPAGTRTSFNLGSYVQTFNVSTVIVPEEGEVICERAVYGGNRAWGTDSIGATSPASTWYLAEGCTDGGFETWVLVQNPNDRDVTVDLTFMTSAGPQAGPRGFTIPARSRHSFNAGEYVTDFNVSTRVDSPGGGVVCERAMYGDSRGWAHDSVGVTSPASTWYLAEGCTDGGFETWVLVQNPNAVDVAVDLTFMTSAGPQAGPRGIIIPANSRYSFNAGEYVTDFNVSTRVESSGGRVICERAVYGGNRAWGTDSIGVTAPSPVWYLAEGCTAGGFETWILVMNPNMMDVTVDLTFMTSAGPQAGPRGIIIPANSRYSFNAGEYVTDYDVSTRVESSGGGVICERSMYGDSRTWAHDSAGFPE